MARGKTYFRVLISATSKREAFKILDALTEQKLVAGGLVTSGDSQYWWRGKRVRRNYSNLSLFTMSPHQKRIISAVRKLQRDEVPIIAFFKIDEANLDFLRWIQTSMKV